MADPKKYQFDLPSTGRPLLFTLEEEFFPGIQASWPHVTKQRTVHPITGIRAVVIHATAGVFVRRRRVRDARRKSQFSLGGARRG